MQTYEIKQVSLGQNKGAPRIFIENHRLGQAGFSPGVRYEVKVDEGRVVLQLKEDGDRVVSGKTRGAAQVPVIDLNSNRVLGQFADHASVRLVVRYGQIHLLPLASRKRARERLDRLVNRLEQGKPLRTASVCHGGGVLSKALHDGLNEAGVESVLVMANDFEPGVLFQASLHNPVWNKRTKAVAAPLQEIVTDDYLLGQVGEIDVLEAGLPCTAASLSGRAKKHLSMAEADEKAGHLVAPFLALINRMQPAIVVLENVPPYQNTASMWLLRHTLRDWGYVVHEAILGAQDFGCLEDRKRLCMVAVTAGLSFEIEAVKPRLHSKPRVRDVLEHVPDDDPSWKQVAYLKAKEERDKAAGKGFRMQLVDMDATRIGTIGSQYMKARSTEPRIPHPDPDDPRSRLLTPGEHAAAKGVDPVLIAGMPATRAHHLLGNGVCPAPVEAVAYCLGVMLTAMVSKMTDHAPAFAAAR